MNADKPYFAIGFPNMAGGYEVRNSIMGNRQGDALGILLGADDDELARFRLFGNQRCFNDHFGHCGVQFPLFNDLEHLF